MSQNDPLLGSHWSQQREEAIDGQSVGYQLNGIQHKTKSTSNQLPNESTIAFNNSLVNNSNHFSKSDQNLSAIQNNSKALMASIGLSSSDSSSEDIVIPMQRRKVKTRFLRKRRSRSTDSNTSVKTRALTACPTICLKLVLILLIFTSIVLIVIFMAKMYDRIDSLQAAINDLSISGNTVPQEMHSIHSHLKQLDTNMSTFKSDLIRAFERIDNLTQEVKQMKVQMTRISDSVEAAPAIRQLPKELQDLQKVVVEMGSRLTTNDNELKTIKDSHNSQQSRSESIERRLSEIQSNVTEMYSTLERNNNSIAFQQRVQQNVNRLDQMSDTLNDLKTVFKQLINWKAEAEPKIDSALAMAQHIHEKLHNSSLEEHQKLTPESQTTVKAVDVKTENNFTESSVQSMAANGTVVS